MAADGRPNSKHFLLKAIAELTTRFRKQIALVFYFIFEYFLISLICYQIKSKTK